MSTLTFDFRVVTQAFPIFLYNRVAHFNYLIEYFYLPPTQIYGNYAHQNMERYHQHYLSFQDLDLYLQWISTASLATKSQVDRENPTQ